MIVMTLVAHGGGQVRAARTAALKRAFFHLSNPLDWSLTGHSQLVQVYGRGETSANYG